MKRKSTSFVIVLAALLVLALASMAGAHAQRRQFIPGPDAVLTTSPGSLDLLFTQELVGITVQVFDINGDSVIAGLPVLDPADAARATVPLKPGLPVGTYTVKWEVDSTDGHSTEGRYLFHITTASDSDVIRVFVDGQEVVSDVPAQIIDGRTMLPMRAVAEALGKWVTWDEQQRFVIVSDNPSSHHHHNAYEHPAEADAPTMKLNVIADTKSGFNLHVETTNWTWAPEQVNTEAAPNVGHGHVYVDGVKVARLYGPWHHIEGLTPGQHDITVTLNANDHADYAVDGHELAETVSVVVKAAADDHDHDHDHDHAH